MRSTEEADITSIHCMKTNSKTCRDLLGRLLKKLNEAYGIRKFASIEELHPQCCLQGMAMQQLKPICGENLGDAQRCLNWPIYNNYGFV